MLIRAAALDSSALDGLFPANPELTTTVLASSIGGLDRGEADPVDVVVECHRRALVLASEAAAEGRPVDAHLMAVLQDVITESQVTYTVMTEHADSVEVDLPRRQYKPVSNYLPLPGGGLAAFAPASTVAAEMERLTGELNLAEFAALHPAVQAAYAHFALTAIHPYADGNGRLARTIASVFLMRSAGVPLVIFAEQWPAYYQALEQATQAGHGQALVDFVCAGAMSVLDLAANLVARPLAGALARDLLTASRDDDAGGDADGDDVPSAAALDEAARGLLQTLSIELREALVAPQPGTRIAIAASTTRPAGHTESAYRLAESDITGRAILRVALRVASRARDAGPPADLEFVALVSTVPGDLLPVALRETRTGELLEVALDDAYPLILEPAVLRIRLWVQRLLATVLDGRSR
jgi:prophage maintenance system killer protein